MEVMDYIIKALLGLISVAVTIFVLPFIENTVIPYLKDKRLFTLVQRAVEAAEKLGESKTMDKKTYVVNALTKLGVNVDDTVDMYIEAAVKEIDDNAKRVADAIKNSK